MSAMEMTSYYDVDDVEEFIEHHGVVGMHWYHRRYQNPDGSLTPEGKRHRASQNIKKFADRASDAAKGAGKAIATAARKKFNPTKEDMDEKIAKAKEKQAIAEKKKELKAIKNNYKNIDQMSDKQVRDQIASLSDRTKLIELREKEKAMKKGKEYSLEKKNDKIKSFGEIIGETATYGVQQASKAAIDIAIKNAKDKNQKENKKSDLDKIKDEVAMEENKKKLADLKFESSNRKTAEAIIKEENKKKLKGIKFENSVASTINAATQAKYEADKMNAELRKQSMKEKDKNKYQDMIDRLKNDKVARNNVVGRKD